MFPRAEILLIHVVLNFGDNPIKYLELIRVIWTEILAQSLGFESMSLGIQSANSATERFYLLTYEKEFGSLVSSVGWARIFQVLLP